MKILRRSLLLTLTLLLFVAIPVMGQEVLEITPSQLTVTAIQQQTVSRTLLIRANQAVQNMSIIPLDLKDAEGGKVLPANAIHVEGDNSTLDSNGLLTVIIRIDLRDVLSGQYTGDLLISTENGNRPVPITVTVKDPPYLPALVLVAGVGLGLVVSEYRSKGKPRDEILVNLGQIRTQIKVDGELHQQGNAFYNLIEAELIDVEVALEAQQWEEAKVSIDKASVVWNLWRRGRSDWLVQLEAYTNLLMKLDSLGGKNVHYIASLLQVAEDTFRKTPTYAGPSELREQLLALYETTNNYVNLLETLKDLENTGPSGRIQAQALKKQLDSLEPDQQEEQKTLGIKIDAAIQKANRKFLSDQLVWLEKKCATLTGEKADAWISKIHELKQELDNLSMDNQIDYQELAGRVEAAVTTIKNMPEIGVGSDETISPDFEMSLRDTRSRESKLVNVPAITLRTITTQVASAGTRLRIFTAITYAVAVILLALAGYVELYVARNDFGSNTVADYFGLLAWGFGAEATRSAITDMVKSWGMVRK
jgi:hypothetical protein